MYVYIYIYIHIYECDLSAKRRVRDPVRDSHGGVRPRVRLVGAENLRGSFGGIYLTESVYKVIFKKLNPAKICIR